MLKIIKNLFLRNSPCRALQKIESENFILSGDCLEVGNFDLDKKSFFNDFSLKSTNIFFCDLKKIKKKNYFFLNLEKKNIINKKFENIIIFNVLEHVFDVDNAFSELYKLLKPNGKLFISTPFLYRYHKAPKDYYRFTSDFYEKITKKKKFKIIYKKSLSTGPFFCSYSIIHNILSFLFPINILYAIIMILIDKVLSFFSKKLVDIYPICNFIILKKKT